MEKMYEVSIDTTLKYFSGSSKSCIKNDVKIAGSEVNEYFENNQPRNERSLNKKQVIIILANDEQNCFCSGQRRL